MASLAFWLLFDQQDALAGNWKAEGEEREVVPEGPGLLPGGLVCTAVLPLLTSGLGVVKGPCVTRARLLPRSTL